MPIGAAFAYMHAMGYDIQSEWDDDYSHPKDLVSAFVIIDRLRKHRLVTEYDVT